MLRLSALSSLNFNLTDSHVKNERESEHADKIRYLIRNRGSCSSSSESTTTGNYEEDVNALRQREIARYARTFSLQEEQMPLATPREDLDVSKLRKGLRAVTVAKVSGGGWGRFPIRLSR